MINAKFGTRDPITFTLSDYPGLTARLRCAGSITCEDTDSYGTANELRDMCLSLLGETMAEYSGKISYNQFVQIRPELCAKLSGKLSERADMECTVDIVTMSLDEQSEKIIRDTDRKRQMSDPEYAAIKLAESEEEARKKREDQKLTDAPDGSAPDDRIIKGDCVPPLRSSPGMMPMGRNVSGEEVFDGGYAGRLGELMPTQFIMPQATQPDIVPAAPPMPDYDAQWDKIRESIPPIPQPVMGIMAGHRPKYCRNCGVPLPETGNFCGECGKPIM